MQSYQARSVSQNPSAINSIADMKRFVEEYPEFRKLGGNVSKHVALVGELSRLVEKNKLLEVGETEQGLATHSGADLKVRTRAVQSPISRVFILVQTVQEIIKHPALSSAAKLRIVILYALRYQKSKANDITALINLLLEHGVSREDARVCIGIFVLARR